MRRRSVTCRHLSVAILAAALGVSAVTVAGAAATTATAPTIKDYVATPDYFTWVGAKVVLKADTTDSKTCEFSSNYAIKSLPGTELCTGGRPNITLDISRNTGTTVKNIGITLTVTASDGAWTAETLYLHEEPEAPAITSFTVTPGDLPKTGGKVTLTGKMVRATECIISASPAVTGLPASFACTSGTVTTTVTLPATTSGLSQTYGFDLTAGGAGGSANAETNAVVAAQDPTVSDFTATPSTLPASGGNVTLSANVTDAVGCNFGDSFSGGTLPAGTNPVTNLPQSVSCTSGTVDFTATVSADTGQKAETITFVMTVNSQSEVVEATQEPVVTEAGTP